MPHLTVPITAWGPLLNCLVTVSEPRLKAILAAKLPPPMPVVVSLLVDTGASGCAIDPAKLAPLGLTPTGSCAIHTPSTGATPHQVDSYDVGLVIFGQVNQPPVFTIGVLPVMASSFNAQGIDGLLGRDFLQTVRLIYSGPDQHVLLSF